MMRPTYPAPSCGDLLQIGSGSVSRHMEQRKKQQRGREVAGDKRLVPAHSSRKPAKNYKPEQARQVAGANDQFRSGVFHALWTVKEEQRSIHDRIPDDSEPCGQTEERHKQPTLIS